jgi:hypothetical protein
VSGDELLREIEELAGCFFSEEEILEILELPEMSAEGKRAIRKGSLASEAKLRKSIIDLAAAGSSPAQTIAVKLMESFKRKTY